MNENTTLAKIEVDPPFNLWTLMPESGYWRVGDFSVENDLVSHDLRVYHCWEPYETELFIEILKDSTRDDCVVDVGAHIGYYTSIAASYNLKVYAVEANSTIYQVLTHNILFNNWKDLCFPINMYAGAVTSNTTITLDDLLKNETRDILILKIDVEGMDPQVIAGAKGLLEQGRIRFIFVEISPKLRTPKEYIEMCNFIVSFGFVAYDIGLSHPGVYAQNTNHLAELRNSPCIDDFVEYIQDMMQQSNFLFIKN